MIKQWVEDNCECGVLESGEWSEELFEEFGCDCRELEQHYVTGEEVA